MKIAPFSNNSSISSKTVRFNLGSSPAMKIAPFSNKSSSSSKTVFFNVGGTIYEVSRSLIEQHSDTMLARYVSHTWNQDGDEADTLKNSKPLFIERDGERFRFCLDYMRDGWVVELPPTVSKDALLQDLAYFGFHDVDPSLISVNALGMYEAYGKIFDSHVKDIEAERELLNLAKHLLIRYKRHETHTLQIHVHKSKLVGLGLKDRFGFLLKTRIRDRFDRILGQFGLKTSNVSSDKDMVTIQFENYKQ